MLPQATPTQSNTDKAAVPNVTEDLTRVFLLVFAVMKWSIAGEMVLINMIEYTTPSTLFVAILINSVSRPPIMPIKQLPRGDVGVVTGSVNMKIAANIAPPAHKW